VKLFFEEYSKYVDFRTGNSDFMIKALDPDSEVPTAQESKLPELSLEVRESA
jgi:hypothetical protein